MEENTIFQGKEGSAVSPEAMPEAQGQVSSMPSPIPQEQLSSAPQPLADDSSTPPSFFSSANFLPLAGIIKALLGIVIIVGIVFVVVRFVLPSFQKSKTANEIVKLSYWGLWEEESVMRSVISDFEKENPNIKVNYTKQDIKQYRERLLTRIQNNTGPDIFRFHNTWFPMLSSILVPLPNDVIQSQDFQKWYYPVAKTDLVRNGAIYGIPLSIDTLSLFINTDILKVSGLEAPKTWDDFMNIARSLTVKDESGKIKTAGVALGTYDNVTHAPDIISLLLVQSGANLKNLSANPQNASDALSFYVSFAQGPGKVWDDTLEPSIMAFSKGNLAMYFGYSWDILAIKVMNPKLSFQVYPVPRLLDRTMTIASYWVEGVSVKSLHQKEALLFIKFLTRKEVSQKLFSESSKTRLFGELYSRADLAETLRENTLIYPFVNQARASVSSFFASDTYDEGLNSQMNSYLGNAVRSMLINTSPQSAVDTLSKGVSQVLNKYGNL